MIHIDLMRRDIAVIITTPTIWERLLLRRSEERLAFAMHSINGSREWYWDATGRPVPEHVRQAIELEVRRLVWQRILAK